MPTLPLEKELVTALEALLTPGKWVHLATVAPDGGPHVTPVVLGYDGDALYLSVTGKQKSKNIERSFDPLLVNKRSLECSGRSPTRGRNLA
ncbi:MAG: hypothetical protein EBU43_03025 [Actinobacteria bacterium]|nr:hypothetical protein [Actinomycetota bacterium]